MTSKKTNEKMFFKSFVVVCAHCNVFILEFSDTNIFLKKLILQMLACKSYFFMCYHCTTLCDCIQTKVSLCTHNTRLFVLVLNMFTYLQNDWWLNRSKYLTLISPRAISLFIVCKDKLMKLIFDRAKIYEKSKAI